MQTFSPSSKSDGAPGMPRLRLFDLDPRGPWPCRIVLNTLHWAWNRSKTFVGSVVGAAALGEVFLAIATSQLTLQNVLAQPNAAAHAVAHFAVHQAPTFITIVLLAALLIWVTRASYQRVETSRRLDKLRTTHYIVERVRDVQISLLLPSYVDGVHDVERQITDADGHDVEVRTYRSLLPAPSHSGRDTCGICVFGPAMMGKTHFLVRASQQALAKYWLVRWPRSVLGAPEFPYKDFRGLRVLIWLDDLDKYIGERDKDTVNDLPRCLREAHVKFVIAATCRDAARTDVMQVFPQLISDNSSASELNIVQLVGITEDQAKRIAADMADSAQASGRSSEELFDSWDKGARTPGSITLGPEYMRMVVWKGLRSHAQHMLHSIQALSFAGIRDYTELRVKAVSRQLFGWPHTANDTEWVEAKKELVHQGYLFPAPGPDQAVLKLRGDNYETKAIPLHGDWAQNRHAIWPQLTTALALMPDVPALQELGLALAKPRVKLFTVSEYDDLSVSVECLAEASGLIPQSGANANPRQWAICIYNRAVSQTKLARLESIRSKRADLLENAESNCKDARLMFVGLAVGSAGSPDQQYADKADILLRRIRELRSQ